MTSATQQREQHPSELLLRQLEHEERLCSGALHLLQSGSTGEHLRDHILKEIADSRMRAESIRQQLQAISADTRADHDVIDTTFETGDDALQNGLPSSSSAAQAEESVSDLSQLTAIFNALIDRPPLGNEDKPMPSMRGELAAEVEAARSTVNVTNNKRLAQRSRSLANPLTRPRHTRTPSNAGGLGTAVQQRLALLERATSLLRTNIRLRYECPTSASLQTVFSCLSDASGKEVRAAAYRLLRYIIVRPPLKILILCRAKGLDLYLTRTFLRDARFLREKEEALKVVRWLLDCGYACVDINGGQDHPDWRPQPVDPVSPAVIRALVAAAENTDEVLRRVYLETLAEIAVHDIGLLTRGDGLRILLGYISDPHSKLLSEVLLICLHLLDNPSSRQLFDPRCDISSIFASFIVPVDSDKKALQSTSAAACSILRSWTGLLYLCYDGGSAIKALLDALRVDSNIAQEAILSMLSALLSLHQADPSTQQETQKVTKVEVEQESSRAFNICSTYMLLLTTVLLDHGLLDVLLHLVEVRSALSQKALDLIQQVADSAKNRLPLEYTYRIHALPDVFQKRFAGKADGINVAERERASSMLSSLEQHSFTHHRGQYPGAHRSRATSSATQIRSKAPVDDTTFRTLLLEANVLSTKDFAKWNVEALQSLFENVLVNAKRLEEAMRASKLVRRVLSFFHPFAMRFSATANAPQNLKLIKLGCTVIETLLISREGAKFLGEDPLLREIGECLSTDLMSEQRFKDTLSFGYFNMLGVLSAHPDGRELLAQANVFTALFRLMDRRVRLDMMRSMIAHVDFSHEGHCRLLLGRATTAHSRTLRMLAARKVFDMAAVEPERWLIRLLVNGLYDTVAENREAASSMLLQACTRSSAVLELVVSMQPKLDQELHSLFLKFLSTSRGFEFLTHGDYIDREMDDWYNHRNVLYANELEAKCTQALAIHVVQVDDEPAWDGQIPPHFYGELVKTKKGCTLLEERGHFHDFARFLRTHAFETSDSEILQKLKGTVWALAHISTSAGGLPLLEQEDVVRTLISIAEHSSVSSLRGTTYLALNLAATTEAGAELIQDAGWHISVSYSVKGEGVSAFCLPSKGFLQLPRWSAKRSSPAPPSAIDVPASRLAQTILRHIASLGNTIIAAKASKSLSRLKRKHPSLFRVQRHDVAESSGQAKKGTEDEADPVVLFVQALHVMNTRPLRQSVRRYVWELFEVRLDEEIVQRLSSVQQAFDQAAVGEPPFQRDGADGGTTQPVAGHEAQVEGSARRVTDTSAEEHMSETSTSGFMDAGNLGGANERQTADDESSFSSDAGEDSDHGSSEDAREYDMLHYADRRGRDEAGGDAQRGTAGKKGSGMPKRRVLGGFASGDGVYTGR